MSSIDDTYHTPNYQASTAIDLREQKFADEIRRLTDEAYLNAITQETPIDGLYIDDVTGQASMDGIYLEATTQGAVTGETTRSQGFGAEHIQDAPAVVSRQEIGASAALGNQVRQSVENGYVEAAQREAAPAAQERVSVPDNQDLLVMGGNLSAARNYAKGQFGLAA